jgi:RnfABCDGE-type electron transport complex D subunit
MEVANILRKDKERGMKVSNLLNVSAAPHVRDQDTTANIMYDVAIALLPATLFGIYQFGIRALLIILVSIITCVLTEYIYQNLMGRPVTIKDGSALVTGLLLALNLSHTLPLWIPLIGGVFAILIVKQLYGGVGQNIMNPALAARVFLLISFAGRMTSYTLDGVTGATPLAVLKNGGEVSALRVLIGTIPGSIGEVSALAIIAGGIYLIVKKIISPKIPLIYLGSFLLFVLLFGGRGFDIAFLSTHLFGGGLLLAAFFMATDYASSPITHNGKVLFGILIGVLTGIFRLFGGSAEGVSYAIILGNLCVPLIEKITVPKAFGKENLKNGQTTK